MVSLLFLFETYANKDTAIKVISRVGFDSHFIEEAQGQSGGIWCLWREICQKIEIMKSDTQYVHFSGY